jgi:predicted nucleic acid-binding protein
MTLDEIRNGARVLIDANVLIYGVRRTSLQCRALLARCETGALEGIITTTILAEFSHRRMMEEAKFKGLIGSNPARALGERREILRQLSGYADEVRDLLGGGLFVEPVMGEDFHLALEFQQKFSLLTNDSLNLAVARRLGLNEISTADKGFDSAQGFIIYKPTDIVMS